MIRGKEQAKIMANSLENRGLRREERYIKTEDDTEKGASKYNWKVFVETSVRERRAIH
jgi:hypothetical protein